MREREREAGASCLTGTGAGSLFLDFQLLTYFCLSTFQTAGNFSCRTQVRRLLPPPNMPAPCLLINKKPTRSSILTATYPQSLVHVGSIRTPKKHARVNEVSNTEPNPSCLFICILNSYNRYLRIVIGTC